MPRKASSTSPKRAARAARYVQLNLNNTIRFRLTPKGLQMHQYAWGRDARAYSDMTGGLPYPFPYTAPKVDRDGYTEEQFWRVMELYGSAMGMGGESPISLNVQILSSDLSPAL